MFFTFSFETTGKMREFFRLSMTFRERCCCQSCAQIQSHTSTAGCGRNLKCFLMVTHGGRKNPVRINIVADEYETFKSHLTQNVTSQLFFFSLFIHITEQTIVHFMGKIYTPHRMYTITLKRRRIEWNEEEATEWRDTMKPNRFIFVGRSAFISFSSIRTVSHAILSQMKRLKCRKFLFHCIFRMLAIAAVAKTDNMAKLLSV